MGVVWSLVRRRNAKSCLLSEQLIHQIYDVCLYPQDRMSGMMMMVAGKTEWMSHMHGSAQGYEYKYRTSELHGIPKWHEKNPQQHNHHISSSNSQMKWENLKTEKSTNRA